MKQKGKDWKVFQSFENDMEDRCVDFFVRPNGTYGFEEYRRDREDDEGWKKMGQYSGTIFSTLMKIVPLRNPTFSLYHQISVRQEL